MTSEHDSTESRLRRFLRSRFGSPAAVYGLIVFSAMVAGVSDEHADTAEVLGLSVFSLVIFFIAHVFAHTLSDHGDLGLRAATWEAIHQSSGMLYAALPSIFVLSLDALDGVSSEDAVSGALFVAVLMLGILGYSAYARRGAPRLLRIIGAIGTAFLGLIIVILDYAVH